MYNELINLNPSDPEKTDIPPNEVTVLKRMEIDDRDMRRAIGLGSLIGLTLGLAFFLPILLFLTFEIDVPIEIALPLCLGAGITAGIMIYLNKMKADVSAGYLRVDDDMIEFTKGRKVYSIPMHGVFGAGPVKNWLGHMDLRIYEISSNKRGFQYTARNFGRYNVVSGPGHKFAYSEIDGNAKAREVIMLHYNRRIHNGQPVAEMPPYNFDGVQTHREFLIAGETIVDAVFECDGKTLKYTKGTDNYEFPVTSIRSCDIQKVQSQYGVSRWDVYLYVDPAHGDKLKIDIRTMPNAQEIDEYCRALPTLFPPQKIDGYWN